MDGDKKILIMKNLILFLLVLSVGCTKEIEKPEVTISDIEKYGYTMYISPCLCTCAAHFSKQDSYYSIGFADPVKPNAEEVLTRFYVSY